MPLNDMTAWNVYAQQLTMLGHGYPLWKGTPSNCPPGVQIGDVGYLSEGEFIRLFNALRPADDPLNSNGVPNNYTPFVKGEKARIVKTPGVIVPSTLCSRTIRQLGMDASVQVTPGNVGAGIGWECTDEQGAVLHLTDPANREQLLSRRMMNHLKQHIKDWYTYVIEDADLNLQREDILFVFGFVKTTQWAAASYIEGGRSARFTLRGGHGPVNAGASAFAAIGNSRAPIMLWGPQPPPTHNGGQGLAAEECIFLQYYKMKWKFSLWPTVIRAGAGYDELPTGPDGTSGAGGQAGAFHDASMADDGVVEQYPERQVWDPANDILDYILKTSDATMAVATESDIVRLCRKHECNIPNDIPAFLTSIHPTIDVSEDGLGMLFFEDEPDLYTEPTAGAVQHTEVEPEQPDTSGAQGAQQPAQEDDNEPADPRKYPAIAVLDHQASGITSLAYSNDGRLLASGSDEAVIQLWDVRNQQLLHTCAGHTQSISSLSFSRDGQEIVSGSEDGQAIVWSTATGQQHLQLGGHTNDIYHVTYSPDGTLIATSSVDSTIRLWNSRTGEEVAVLRGHNALVMMTAFSPNGRLIASASADFTARVWHVPSGQELSRLRGHSGVVYSLAFSPDNRRIVTAAEDGTARVWNAQTGEELVTLREHLGPVWTVIFSGDGMNVISGASDGTIKVCDSYGGELRLSLDTGDMLVNAIAFSANGDRVCASAEDNSIRIWNTATGELLTTLAGHEDKITHLKFSLDGKRVASSSDDGMLRLWDLERLIFQPNQVY